MTKTQTPQALWQFVRANHWVGAKWVFLLFVAVCAAFFVSPGLYSENVPALNATDEGKPFRAPSGSGFKANRDFEIVDIESTQIRREEASASVRAVYDFDASVQEGIRRSVRQAFSQMRAVVTQYRSQDSFHKEGDAALTERLRSVRSRHALWETLEDEDFETLVQMRFAPDIEAAVSEYLNTLTVPEFPLIERK